MQVDINFTPRKIGDHSGELVIHYETGMYVRTIYVHTYMYSII